jgi:hypothetical protein
VEENEYDDVFLKYEGEKIWPIEKKQQPIMMDTTTELDIEIRDLNLFKQVEIELWDWDFLKPNDLMGTFSLIIEGSDGQYSTDMIQNRKKTKKAKYTLVWELI